MELIELMSVIVPCAAIVGAVVIFSKQNKGKKKVQKVVGEAVDNTIDVMNQTLEVYKKELKRVNGQNAQLKKKLDEIEDMEVDVEPEKVGVTFEQVKEYAKTKGINPSLLELPMIKDHVKDFIKGKSIAELEESIRAIQTFTGKNGKLGTEDPNSGYKEGIQYI